MGFAVLFGLLMIVSGWWLYSRWASLRDSQSQRREAESMLVFEARAKSPPAAMPSPAGASRATAGDFVQTLPGGR
ncbi:MAG: hypothetical protein ABIZ18_05195 [Caldimonas sp.]